MSQRRRVSRPGTPLPVSAAAAHDDDDDDDMRGSTLAPVAGPLPSSSFRSAIACLETVMAMAAAR